MERSASDTSKLLRVIADLVETMSAKELKALTAELRGRAPKAVRASGTLSIGIPIARFGPADAEDIASRIEKAANRADGEQILREASLNKRDLTYLARSRSVHVTKEDNVARIEEKLVEALIGSRLSSDAIRGTSSNDRSGDKT